MLIWLPVSVGQSGLSHSYMPPDHTSTRGASSQPLLSSFLHEWASCRDYRDNREEHVLPRSLFFCEPSTDWFLHESLVERFTIFTTYKNALNLTLKDLHRKGRAAVLTLPTLVFRTGHLCIIICMERIRFSHYIMNYFGYFGCNTQGPQRSQFRWWQHAWSCYAFFEAKTSPWES